LQAADRSRRARRHRLITLPRAAGVSVIVFVLAVTGGVASQPGSGSGQPHHRRGRRARRHGRQCVHAHASATRAALSASRAAVVCEINDQRAAYGLPPLHASERLDRAAQGWSSRMVATDRFNHANLGPRVTATGFRWTALGEAIATGYDTPHQVVAGWMASASHCHLMLSPTYTAVGTGIARRPVPGTADGGDTWTEDFALAAGKRAPSRNFAPADGCPY
jgi:uncharacterized protein YkwD